MSIHAVDWEVIEWQPVRAGIERKTFTGDGATLALQRIQPGFEFSSWNGFLAPVGTSETIIAAIGIEITVLARSVEISERLIKLGIVPGGLTKEQSEAVFRRDHESFAARSRPRGDPRAAIVVSFCASGRSPDEYRESGFHSWRRPGRTGRGC